ncbi:hypothetical protein PV10_08400 [Exophiala mesophila]|uniref:SPX domain-containing protein n=1 Tax=Exophiala mesophila TaxID=212818 RepID=A0A0D1Z4A0_EXOME|nr:uncharacterized protein PV10_08400 [Exophiala mesophila]KIV88749.1 hypothetical protein PV10_08400 [Exophiala mesophila]
MKFGDTIYQRSVPKWAAYNFKYNELKHLIKSRTSAGHAVPLDIPSHGKSRWEELDTQLLKLLQDEYDNITLFLRSKQGEIDRRLSHLEKQIAIAHRAVAQDALDRPILQARKYQRLVKDSEEIADEVQNLARFAAVQKTAFRKILKKYRKWTGSTSLQTRLDVEVFSSDKLRTDYSDYLLRLSDLNLTLHQTLASPMLTGKPGNPIQQANKISTSANGSAISQIDASVLQSPLTFDATLLTVPYGQVAGSAYYWIHPDNYDEARTLLLRHMRDIALTRTPSRTGSEASLSSQPRKSSLSPDLSLLHAVFFDNSQRYIKDTSTTRPTRIALSAYYSQDSEAAVTLAGLSPTSSGTTVLSIKTKDLAKALQRSSSPSVVSSEVSAVQKYLSQHRDVKSLAEFSSRRTRYSGMTNSADVATWATLDTNITTYVADTLCIGQPGYHPHAGEAFPYAVLHIRWEFARVPSVVRAFDESHLVERVNDFTLEAMAIHTVHKDLPSPSWLPLLDKDIRKVPLVPHRKRAGLSGRGRNGSLDIAISSGPSSADEPPSSVFSANPGHSSATSEEVGALVSHSESAQSKPQASKPQRTKKRARIQTPNPQPRAQRYWNEFDDGDSDVNQDEGYAIYVDPNEPIFPGADAVHKAIGVMCDSVSKGTIRVLSWFPLTARRHAHGEREPLLSEQRTSDDGDSSGSDTDDLLVPQQRTRRPQRTLSHGSRGANRPGGVFLTPRQKQLENTIFIFYTGLIGISAVFLVMSSILLGTGRRKAFVEVDAGVVAGVVAAETCAVGAIILILIRKQRLSIVHWGLVGVSVSVVVVVGMALLALMFSGAHRSIGKKTDV